jgi:hypothetical protein
MWIFHSSLHQHPPAIYLVHHSLHLHLHLLQIHTRNHSFFADSRRGDEHTSGCLRPKTLLDTPTPNLLPLLSFLRTTHLPKYFRNPSTTLIFPAPSSTLWLYPQYIITRGIPTSSEQVSQLVDRERLSILLSYHRSLPYTITLVKLPSVFERPTLHLNLCSSGLPSVHLVLNSPWTLQAVHFAPSNQYLFAPCLFVLRDLLFCSSSPISLHIYIFSSSVPTQSLSRAFHFHIRSKASTLWLLPYLRDVQILHLASTLPVDLPRNIRHADF